MSIDSPDVNAETVAAEAALNDAAKQPQSPNQSVFIEDWRHAWRFFSMWCISAAGTLQMTWDLVPPDIRAALPDHTQRNVTISFLVLGAIGRLIKQTKATESE